VLLVSEDLSAIYATLNQGMTDLVNELGQKAAVRALESGPKFMTGGPIGV
jgi:hypothetical protein